MQSIGKLFIVSILVVLPIHLGFADDGEAVDTTQQWEVLLHSAKEILTGSLSGQTGVKIAPSAQLAIGDTLMSLSDVVGGKSKTHSSLEGTPVSVRLRMNAEENMATFLLGTHPEPDRSPRYHTVVFMKDSTGMWLIVSWVASY